jgi:hypothetical protein
MYLIVDLPPLIRRVWKLDDSGTFTLRSSDLGDVTQQAIGTVELVRMTEKTTDWGGNTLVGQVFSRQTWNASTVARSCKSVLATNPSAPSGPYMLQPDIASPPQLVYCDMTTDGGGWTLVASANSGIDDMGVPYNGDLAGLAPTSNMGGVWNQAAAILASDRSDIRFACRARAGGAAFDVDLSFYDNVWFHEMATAATDDLSCFNEGDGAGADPPPARTDNISGATLAAGNQWNYGYLEGEDYCGDNGDFTVDFDDRGMDSNQSDGTDWGEDDTQLKCGRSGLADGQWFVFAREVLGAVAPLACPGDDPYEQNDDRAGARLLPDPAAWVFDGILCGADDDWFALDLQAGCTYRFQLDFVDADGDVDLYVVNANDGAALGESSGVTDQESVLVSVPAGAAVRAAVQVDGFLFGAGDSNSYRASFQRVSCP